MIRQNWPAGVYACFLLILLLYTIFKDAPGVCESGESLVACIRNWAEALTLPIAATAVTIALLQLRTARTDIQLTALEHVEDRLTVANRVEWISAEILSETANATHWYEQLRSGDLGATDYTIVCARNVTNNVARVQELLTEGQEIIRSRRPYEESRAAMLSVIEATKKYLNESEFLYEQVNMIMKVLSGPEHDIWRVAQWRQRLAYNTITHDFMNDSGRLLHAIAEPLGPLKGARERLSEHRDRLARSIGLS